MTSGSARHQRRNEGAHAFKFRRSLYKNDRDQPAARTYKNDEVMTIDFNVFHWGGVELEFHYRRFKAIVVNCNELTMTASHRIEMFSINQVMWSSADNKTGVIVSLTHPKVNDLNLSGRMLTSLMICFSLFICSRQLKWRNDLRRYDYWNLDVRLDWPIRTQILPNWPIWRTTDAGHRTASMSHWHWHSMGKFRNTPI